MIFPRLMSRSAPMEGDEDDEKQDDRMGCVNDARIVFTLKKVTRSGPCSAKVFSLPPRLVSQPVHPTIYYTHN